jgi:hypothetical protein
MMLNRDQILNLAEKHRSKITGLYFTAAELEKFWKDAYKRGQRGEREKRHEIKRMWVGLTDRELERLSESRLEPYDLCLAVEELLRVINKK